MQRAWLDLPVLLRLHAQARGQQVAQPERTDGVFAIQGTASAQRLTPSETDRIRADCL